MAQRLHGIDPKQIADVNTDDGDRNFGVGIVQNRFDILSEADLIYKGKYGMRVSGAFWYDQRYDGDFDNNSRLTSNHTDHHGNQSINLSGFADRYFNGPSGELLDAFVFGKLDAGSVPIYLKAGRHTIYWGEILLSAFNGINVNQAPLDLPKAFAQPGVEVKEVFRPLNQISAVAQVSNELTLAAQWFLQWERNLVPEAGTYLSASDLNMRGSQILLLPVGPGAYAPVPHGSDLYTEGFHDFGLNARWSPEWLHGGTIGVYFRNTSDKLPQAIVCLEDFTYRFAYADDIQVYGLSYSNVVLGGSMGAEASIRARMPLRSETQVAPTKDDLPEDGELLGARGTTFHAMVNYLGLLKRTPLWDAGNYIIELNYSRWLDVTDNEDAFKGRDDYSAIDGATRDSAQIAVNFSPQWLQVLPGLDISMPASVSYGIWGVAAEVNNGAKGEGLWGIGLLFDIFTKYKVRLDYVNYFGKVGIVSDAAGNPTEINRAGQGAGTGGLTDRDFISLTFKTSF
ncbi:MAG: DUF1302 domain-containing protein [Syntrophobacteraceae bacterium]